MDLNESYNLSGFEFEPEVREIYKEGIKTLRESNNPKEYFQAFEEMLEALGESHSSPEKGIEWAKELIFVYRNMGRIFEKISSEISKQISPDYEPIPKSLLDKLGKFESGEFKGETYVETIESIFEELEIIYEILDNHHILSSDLVERLEKADEADKLLEKINRLEMI